MSANFEFQHRVQFQPENADAILRSIPAAQGVVALRGDDPAAEPYLTRATDLRRRLRRLLAPPEALNPDGTPVLSKRLNLRNRVRFIEWTATGSDFESTLVLYKATRQAFGPDAARKRLRLHTPYMLRMTISHEHPRVYTTNRLSQRSIAETFGPFPSRAAADRYCDAVLDLFQLRRCYEDLVPHPEHPGCVYGEMNKCMRPCQLGASQACTPAQYAAESQRVLAFLRTRGQSLLDEVAAQRESASESMDFELAATLHKHWEKVRAATLLADELIGPITDLRAVIIQPSTDAGAPFIAGHHPAMSGVANVDPATNASAPPGVPDERSLLGGVASTTMVSSSSWVGSQEVQTDSAAVFLLEHGHLAGPEPLSTLGIRAVREQTAVGSSLFAQPLMLAPIPLDELPAAEPTAAAAPGVAAGFSPRSTATNEGGFSPGQATTNPEDRARTVLNTLSAQTETTPDIADLCDTLSLFRRWYYRPEKQRTGEVFLPNPDHSWPIRRILNGAARVVLGPPTLAPAVDREAAKILKTKTLHEGREGIERDVPVLPKRSRSRKAVTPTDVQGNL